MRKSRWGLTVATATVFSVSSLLLAGCQTGSNFRMPSLSWNKKKSDTSLDSSASSLPAPPSRTAAPSTPPSYAQNPAPRPETPTWNASQPTNSPSNGGYGAQSPGAYAAGSGSARGFYSRDYRDASAAGNEGQTPAGPSYAPPGGANLYGANTQPSATAPRGYAGETYGMSAGTNSAPNRSTSPYGSNMGSPSSPAPQPYGSTSPYAGGSSHAANASPAYGGPATSSGSIYGQSGGYAAPSQNTQGAQQSIADNGYLPGSTSRTTPYGSGANLYPQSVDPVQPASFAGGRGTPGTSYPPSAPMGSGYGSDPYAPSRTATGAGSSYPNTYQR